MKSKILILFIVISLLYGCATAKKNNGIALNYFEYARGMSSPAHADVYMKYENNDYTLSDVYMEDQSFFEDNSIIPNAFIKPLFSLKIADAIKAFTEPYYSYRFIHFFKSYPNFGIGVEFIHHKVFMMDKDQKVHLKGTFRGEEMDEMVRVGDYLDLFTISHGINHASFHLVYRWLLSPSAKAPEGRYQPYVNVSFGPAIPHLEIDTTEENGAQRRAYSYQSALTNWGFGFGTGIRYKPWKKLGFYLEYKLTYSYLKGMHFDEVTGTRVSVDFLSHHLQWGLSFMF